MKIFVPHSTPHINMCFRVQFWCKIIINSSLLVINYSLLAFTQTSTEDGVEVKFWSV